MESNMFQQVRQYAPAVSTAIVFSYYYLWSGVMTQAQYKQYLPTDRSLLDIVGVDIYNDGHDPASSASLQSLATPWVNFAGSESKPLGIFELGTRQAAGSKPQWIQAAMAYIKSQPSIKGALWFHANITVTIDPLHDYWIDGDGTDTQSFNYYKLFTSDSYFVKGS